MPMRVQRRRSKGWRMPPNTVYVGRPTKWGNPFRVDGATSRAQAVALYRDYLRRADQEAVRRGVLTLRGKHLACWCPLDQPCHADALLELANR